MSGLRAWASNARRQPPTRFAVRLALLGPTVVVAVAHDLDGPLFPHDVVRWVLFAVAVVWAERIGERYVRRQPAVVKSTAGVQCVGCGWRVEGLTVDVAARLGREHQCPAVTP